MIKFSKSKIIVLFSIFYLLFTSQFSEAAELFLESENKEMGIGSRFIVNLFFSAEENINAIEGQMAFPEELLELKEIRDGGSIVNFWIEQPSINNGEIYFSGIIPGGYSNGKGLVISAVFEAKKEGEGIIELKNAKALLNNGEGTPAAVKISNFRFLISKNLPIVSYLPFSKIDIEPPENFLPQIAQNPNVFNGKYFLVFASQDKDSGISHYEVKEGRGKFLPAQSPYLLENQNLDEKIYVKAVDREGNERTAVLAAKNPRPQYKDYFIFAILIITGLFLGFRKILWRRK